MVDKLTTERRGRLAAELMLEQKQADRYCQPNVFQDHIDGTIEIYVLNN